jgi:hypothetical protein
MSNNQIDPAFIKKLDEIIAKAVQNGGLMIIGSNQCGKTKTAMWIARRIMDNSQHESHEYKLTVFDTCLNWRYLFDKIPFIDFSSTRLLPVVQDLIIDVSNLDPIDTRNNISSVLAEDFQTKQRLKAELVGKIPFVNFYFIEEMQNVFGSYALGQKNGRFNLRIFSEGSNFGMVFIGIGQRLSDISTRIIERRRYFLFGRANGDNDIQKIARMFNQQVADNVKGLQVGSFLFYDKETGTLDEIGFPIFTQMGKPEQAVFSKTNGYVKRIWG